MTTQICVDCGSDSPQAGTSNTLSGLGWRLHRHADDTGAVVFDWRCPGCWKAFTRRRERASSPPLHDSPAEAFARAARKLRRGPDR
jgi:hypothetical protein